MSPQLGIAALLGLALGLGLWTILGSVPRFARARLIDRVAPHVIDISEDAREHVNRRSVDPLPVLGTLFAPIISALRRVLSEFVGGNEIVRMRLRQAGSSLSLERFRTAQAVWALVGALVGVVVAALLLRDSVQHLAAAIVMPILGALLGTVLRDYLLKRAAVARIRRIASEYPTVLEFLSLSLAAGEGIVDALIRVSRMSNSELSREFAGVVVRVRAGTPVAQALAVMARDLNHTPLSRTVDHIVTAIERGAPLVEALRAQAQDARELSKRHLLEESGRAEIKMMVPLVLLILPITVLFAVFPSYFVLTTTF